MKIIVKLADSRSGASRNKMAGSAVELTGGPLSGLIHELDLTFGVPGMIGLPDGGIVSDRHFESGDLIHWYRVNPESLIAYYVTSSAIIK